VDVSSVTIRFYSVLRLKLGREELRLEAESLGEALERLKGSRGNGFSRALFDGGRLKRGYAVILKGKRVPEEEFGTTALEEGDVIHLFPPLGGG